MKLKKIIIHVLMFVILCGMRPLIGAQSDPGGTQDIFHAVREGSLDSVTYWLDRGVAIDSTEYGETPLIAAVNNGLSEIATELIFRRANIEARGHGYTVLMLATASNLKEVVGLLLDKGALVEARDDQEDRTALMMAAESGYSAIVQLLLDRGADINAWDHLGKTALMLACASRELAMVQLLLDRKAVIDARDQEGKTPLMIAAEKGWMEGVQLFLDRGITIESMGKASFMMLLMHVVKVGPLAYVRELLDKGMILDFINQADLASLLIHAVRFGSLEVVRELLSGASVDAKDKDGKSALKIAVEKNRFDIVSELLARGARIEDAEAKIIFDKAVQDCNASLMRALQLQGFGRLINQDDPGKKPLLIASVKSNNYKRVKFLLESGANPRVKDKLGFDAFDYLFKKKNSELITLFNDFFPEDMGRREGAKAEFSGYILGQALLTPTELHYKKFEKEIELRYGMQLDNPIVRECIEKERIAYQQGNYVFYRAEPGKYRVYQYFLKELDAVVRSFGKKNSFIFTRFFKDAAQESTINEYVEKLQKMDQVGDMQNVLLSANIPLFGNVNNPGSCTWDYFIKNKEALRGVNLFKMFEHIFDVYGFDQKYIGALLKLNETTPIEKGSLQQIIIPKNIVDDVAMLASVGYAAPWRSVVDESCWKQQVDKIDNNKTIGRHTCIASIIDKYRSGEIAIDDAFQARILMNARYGLNPNSGIEFNMYADIPQEDLAAFGEQVKKVVDAIFGTWLAHQIGREGQLMGVERQAFRYILKNYGKGDPDRQKVFFNAFKAVQANKKQEVPAEPKKNEEEEKDDASQVREMGQVVAHVAAQVAREEIDSEVRKGVQYEAAREASLLEGDSPATIWQEYAARGDVTPARKESLFMEDCARNAVRNMRIPKKHSNVIRIATYNVHFWTNLLKRGSYNQILETIKAINADVLLLQEVRLFDEQKIHRDFSSMDYKYPAFMPMQLLGNDPFGNMIFSKYPFVGEPFKKVYASNKNVGGVRNFINAIIQLPDGDMLSVYDTHLDVHDATGVTRMQQVRELVEHAQRDSNNPNVLLAGDWNAVREKDYQYEVAGKSVWQMQTEQFLKRAGAKLGLKKIPTDALEYVEGNGFNDCFTLANATAPWYTVWAGTVVDFIFCAKTWNLPIVGSYVYFSAASDHLPVIMDVRMAKTKSAERGKAAQEESAAVAERKDQQKEQAIEG
ncbi:MAG TPA: ankyrin repeat domain-containing protein [Candidatus Babeliales bacterium]|nr:ankyrin repeat domain-containing protein [Candidatus Babeliales bacterium]